MDTRDGAHPVEVVAELDPDGVAAVLALVERAAGTDGVSALNEQALLRVRAQPGAAPGRVRHVLAYDRAAPDTGGLVAYAHLDRSEPTGVTAELVVHPEHRRAGWATAIVTRALAEVDGAPMLLWSHGDHPGAEQMSHRLGFARVRELWQLRRALGPDGAPLPDVRMPPGVAIRPFRVGADEADWLQLNAKAFADHPEQGSTDAGDLARRIESDWFDPDGFFLAERHGRLVGFHWTKVHAPANPTADPTGDAAAVGEVYVVGVDPDEQGSGLGSALTLTGLHHLASLGLGAVLLYVEADNAAALRVYHRLGFNHVGTDTQYRHPGR